MSNASSACGVGGEATAELVAQMTYNRECGGFGVCNVVENVCVCDAASWWVGSSDFIDAAAFDCPTNLIYVYILWALNVLEVVVVVVQSHGVVLARFENFFEQRRQNPEYTIVKNRGLLAVALIFGITMPFQVAFAIIKLINPTRQIGIDPLVTSFFFIAKFGLYTAIFAYQPALLQSILKGAKGVDTILKFNISVSFITNCVSASVGGVFFVSLFLTSLETRIWIARAYYITQSVCLFTNGCMGIYARITITRVLDQSASLVSDSRNINKTMKLKARLNDVQGEAMKQGLSQGIIFLVFFLLPGAWDKHDYLLPLSWFAMPILGKRAAFAINLDGVQNKSLVDRFLKKKEHSTTAGDGVTPGSQTDIQGTHTRARKANGSTLAVGGGSVLPAVDETHEHNSKEGQVVSFAPTADDAGGSVFPS